MDDDQQKEVAWLQGDVARLRAEVDALAPSLSEVATEEAELVEQLRSLKYALELTRGELERRTRANTELVSAYSTGNENADTDDVDTEHDNNVSINSTPEQVQGLEAELLNAKRDAANVVYEIESLQVRYKQLLEMERVQREGNDSGGGGGTAATDGMSINNSGTKANNNNNNITGSSTTAATVASSSPTPSISSPLPSSYKFSTSPSHSPSAPTAPTASPKKSSSTATTANPLSSPSSASTRSARLIADVDALIGFGFAFAPCRLGLAANGQIAIYSYASPAPLLVIDDILDRTVDKLSTADALALADGLRAVRVHTESRGGDAIRGQVVLDKDDEGDEQEGEGEEEIEVQSQNQNQNQTQTLCGLAEAVRAATQLMEDSKNTIHTGQGRT